MSKDSIKAAYEEGIKAGNLALKGNRDAVSVEDFIQDMNEKLADKDSNLARLDKSLQNAMVNAHSIESFLIPEGKEFATYRVNKFNQYRR